MSQLSEPVLDRAFLSTALAQRTDRRLAIVAGFVSLSGFVVMAPFARLPLPQVWGFIPSYESALAVTDLITAALLLSQFGRLGSRALLVLGCGYLFSALMAVPHALTFPGLFSVTGLLGAGPQSTAWLYMFWHGGFPLLVTSYALLKRAESRTTWQLRHVRAAGICAAVAVVVAVCCLTLLATAAVGALPNIMAGNGYTPVMRLVVSSVWMLSVVALVALLWQRPLSVLDLWLAVVMCAWLSDIALSAVLNAGRFDLGFYAGRIYGLLAASFVLVVLLTETGNLYARLASSLQLAEERNHELRASELALRQARDAAVGAEKAKSQFLATASHDLRQPLHAMNLFISALRRRVSGPEAPMLVDNMGAAVKSMQMMFDSLLDISKLNAGVVTPAIQDSAVEDVLAQLRNEFAGPAAAKGIDFIIRGSPATVRTDPTLLQSILRNLISNAVRYTKAGHVTLECSEYGAFLRIQVVDTGTGIPADKLELAFNEFQRFDKSDARERGLGLGLAIVRRLARLLDLKIDVASEVGRGSTFSVEIPLSTATAPSNLDRRAAATPLVGRRVLLVEDDPMVREAVAREISDWGAEAITAATPDEALDLVAAQPRRLPDVAIIDRDLGKSMTGPQLLRSLVARFGAIPAVIVTGATDPDALAELRASNLRWLTKPVDSNTLKGVIGDLLPVRSAVQS
jgi:two-component system, sensor histidine kinase and response regulator